MLLVGRGEEDGAETKADECWWLMLLTHRLKDNQLAWESSRKKAAGGMNRMVYK